METTPNENDRLGTREDMLLLKVDLDALGARIDQLFKNQLKWIFVIMVGWFLLMVAAIKLL
jgi:hypothetical protein